MSTAEGEVDNVQQAALCCPRCDAANLPERKYCSKCGTSLWEACLRCGEVSAVGENFCGACGANLGDAAAEQLERVQDAFRTVAELQRTHRFNEAIAALTTVAENSHQRLAVYAARATKLIQQLDAERDRQRRAADEVLQRARGHFEQAQYEEAASLLAGVPESLRNTAMQELAGQISDRQEEISELRRTIQEGFREKRIVGLLPEIDRLLLLTPGDAYVTAIAERVRQHVIVAAEKAMAEFRYQDSLTLLEHLTPEIGGRRSQELFCRAAELAWLKNDLHKAPIIDATLLAVAERLQRLAPSDADAVKLCQRLQQRVRETKRQGQDALVSWAPAPKEPPFGVPVDWFTSLGRLNRAAGLNAADYDSAPGRFIVATGLALTGLKQSASQINLLAAEQHGTLHRMKRLFRGGSAKVAWGLDLSASGLKAIKLSWNESKRQATLESAVYIEHAKSLNNAINEAESQKLISNTLTAFAEKCQPGKDRIVVALPSRMALSRQVELPPVEASKVPRMIEFEAQQQFPFPLEQLSWSYELLSASPAEKAKERIGPQWRSLLLVAAQNTLVHRFLEPFRRLHLQVDMLQTDFLALHNALVHENFPPEEASGMQTQPHAIVAVDVGCDVTNIVISRPDALWFHSCGTAGHSFTRTLVKEFNLSVAQAEQLKRTPETATNMSDLYRAVSPLIEDLLQEVQQSLVAYAKANPDYPIQRLVGLGGGFLLHGLFRSFRCGL